MKKISNTLIVPSGSVERFLVFRNAGSETGYPGGKICGGISDPLLPGYRVVYRKNASEEWMYVIKGSMTFRWQGKEVVAGRGDFVFLPSSLSPHDIQVADVESGMIWFHIRPDADDREWNDLPTEPFCRPAGFSGEIKLLAELLYLQELKNSSGKLDTMLQIQKYLKWEVAGNSSGNGNRERIYRIYKQVQSNLKYPWNVSELARMAYLSESHFFSITKLYFGESPQDIIRRWRMELAIQLLLRTELSLKEIAAECGYGDAYAFSKAFRKHIGRTPGSFRREENIRKKV